MGFARRLLRSRLTAGTQEPHRRVDVPNRIAWGRSYWEFHMPILSKSRKAFLIAGSVLGLALASTAAMAQDYYDGPYYRSGEEVIVTAPRHQERSSTTGAPIRNVSMSHEIRFNDLDLRTRHGAHRLYERVSYTAQRLCRDLDVRYPVGADDGDSQSSCYHRTMDDAMAQADEAIHEARGGSY
jgi:UrcA family protein